MYLTLTMPSVQDNAVNVNVLVIYIYIYTVFPRMLTAVTISFRCREAANTKRGRIELEGECNIN